MAPRHEHYQLPRQRCAYPHRGLQGLAPPAASVRRDAGYRAPFRAIRHAPYHEDIMVFES